MRHSSKYVLWTVVLLLIWSASCNATAAADGKRDRPDPEADAPRSRQKRLVWITTDGRLALPPGTELSITPSLSLPFVRYPPDGFLSNMSINLPFTINFDTLGLTDNENPFGAFPNFMAKSMGRSMSQNMGSVLTKYVAQLLTNRRSKRDIPRLPKPMHSYFKGGERALLYAAVEDLLTNLGMDGKACLLRAICEVHGHTSLHKFGFLGEIMQLFLTASRSTYANVIKDYVIAETVGKEGKECFEYFKECPKSLFTTNNRYSKNDRFDDDEEAPVLPDDELLQSLSLDDDDGVEQVGGDGNDKSGNGPRVTVNPTPIAM